MNYTTQKIIERIIEIKSISTHDLNRLVEINAELRSFVENFLFSFSIAPNAKENFLKQIKEQCLGVSKAISEFLKRANTVREIEIIIDFVGTISLLGCDKVISEQFKVILAKIGKNIDLLAHLADVLIETGNIQYAYLVLKDLFRKGYNLRAVAINLAIVSYMLGYPQVAKKYLEFYQKMSQRKSSLMVSLKIALADFTDLNMKGD